MFGFDANICVLLEALFAFFCVLFAALFIWFHGLQVLFDVLFDSYVSIVACLQFATLMCFPMYVLFDALFGMKIEMQRMFAQCFVRNMRTICFVPATKKQNNCSMFANARRGQSCLLKVNISGGGIPVEKKGC